MKSNLAALLASVAFPAQAGLDAANRLELDTTGALARVHQDHLSPLSCRAQILSEAPFRRPHILSGWVRTAVDAEIASAMLIKTSYPRARLEFVLDDTEYRTFVTPRNVEPSVTPLVR